MDTIAEYDAALADTDAEMRPIMERRRSLHQDREALADLLAESPDISDADLLAISELGQGPFKALQDRVRVLHPAIFDIIGWSGWGESDEALRAMRGPYLTVRKDAEDYYLAELETALVEFAARFCPEIPASFEEPGMVFADILDHECGETHDWFLFYEPVEGGQAILADRRNTYGDRYEGTLIEVLGKVSKHAYGDTRR